MSAVPKVTQSSEHPFGQRRTLKFGEVCAAAHGSKLFVGQGRVEWMLSRRKELREYNDEGNVGSLYPCLSSCGSFAAIRVPDSLNIKDPGDCAEQLSGSPAHQTSDQ